ncbi:MAG: PCMD domain-containing protein [Muribaculaceae bacterium]|nr:PCMD domain-containing protein [Muribaculaceae bacterium]MDE6818185.1 PCMD domain-containing protein [Muribaculaceae bacterium]
MSIFKKILTGALVAIGLGGCIKNDLPYPRIECNITDIMVDGQSAPAVIDPQTRTVTLTMSEIADLQSVEILSFKVEPENCRVDGLKGNLNLIRPAYATLSLYQDYVWTIRADQTIERYITVDPQMGEPVIDVPGRRVIVYVPKGTDLTKLTVTSLKLGSPAATVSPAIVGVPTDFTRPVELVVTDHGRSSLWTIFAETVDATVTLTGVDAWTRVAWFYASVAKESDAGFEYRLQGSTDWTKVEDVTKGSGVISARALHLSPSTTYEVRAYCGTDVSASQPFTTGTEAQLPNSTMDLWWKDDKVWNPWGEGQTPFWDTGNKGATTLGESNSQPTADTQSGTGYAAQLKTEFKGIGPLGKIAAGSVFSGVYVRTDGTNGILNFGRQFSERPTRLRAMFKYKNAPISHVGTDSRFADWKGRPDTAQIFIALTDWNAPMEIRTNPKNQQLFNPADPSVIAYGQVSYGSSVEQWTPLSIDLQYRSTSRVPKYILVVCTSSKYGDYFVGGNGGILTIDDLTLEYDY